MSKPSTSRALITRRRLFIGALAGAALACAGAIRLPGAAIGYTVLSADELRMVAALGEALFPEGNPVGPGAAEVELPVHVDALLTEILSGASVTGFRWVLRVLRTGAWFSGKDFMDMDVDERLALLNAWGAGPVYEKASHDAVKSVLGLAYFNHPQVLSFVGFRSRCHLGRG